MTASRGFDYRHLAVERRHAILIVVLDRPEVLNALNEQLMQELGNLLRRAQADETVRCVILAGGERAFAAGGDIREMAVHSYASAFRQDIFAELSHTIASFNKPLIAAVGGYALGGGCELAMLCDFIIAATDARFGQPELGLGIAPGLGGSQRLARAIGRCKAMDMILTGRLMGAQEASDSGLVARVVERRQLLAEACEAAEAIIQSAPAVTTIGKRLVNETF